MQKKISNILLIIACSGILSACDTERIYEENFPVENQVWNAEDIKTFSFEITDTLSPVDLYVNVRTTTDYPYSNLYIFLYSDYPTGYTDKDTLEFILAEPDGRWLGENSGTVVENQILIARGGFFSVSGTYTFKIQHAMREVDLPEIMDVGFRVAYTPAK